MAGLAIGLGVFGGLILLIALYWLVISSMYPEKLRTNEVHTLVTGDLWKLRMCRYRKGRTEGEPILFVHGFNSNQHNFTSPPGGCSVDYLVAKGYDCWTLDVRGSRSSKSPFEHSWREATIDDVVRHDIPAAIQYIRKNTGYGKVHWIGHSMGGMLLYAYTLYAGPDLIASGTTLGAPIGFSDTRNTVPGFVTVFARCFPRFAGNILRGIAPIALKLRLGNRLFPINLRNLAPGMTAGHFFAMLDVPQPRILAELTFWYKHRVWRMMDDTFDVAAALKELRVPLLAFYGPKDPFVNLESGKAFIEQLPYRDKRIVILSKEAGCLQDYNHCDLAFGKEGAKEVFEPIAKWLAEHPIHERVNLHTDLEGGSAALLPPLKEEERAGILSGESFAHLQENGEDAEAEKEQPIPAVAKKKPAAKKKAVAKPRPAAKAAAKPAPKKKPAAAKPAPAPKAAPKKKPAAVRKASLELEPMDRRARPRKK